MVRNNNAWVGMTKWDVFNLIADPLPGGHQLGAFSLAVRMGLLQATALCSILSCPYYQWHVRTR